MQNLSKQTKIHLLVDRIYSKAALDALAELGISDLHVENGRSLQLLQEADKQVAFTSKAQLNEEQVLMFSFVSNRSWAKKIVQHLTEKLSLNIPGKGSIYAKDIELALHTSSLEINEPKNLIESEHLVSSDLIGIACVVQKGEGNHVAQIGLSTGTAMPVVSYGIGTGLRNRLGLWRILIPAEKEVSTLVVNRDEADTVMDMMIDVGQLDQPGKGFIFQFPIELGVLNTKFSVGESKQAASIEQIISAIDTIQGSTEWRRKSFSKHSEGEKQRRYLTGLVDFSLICNEGFGETLTQCAMEAGAAGATIRHLKYMSLHDRKSSISPAREISVMTIGQAQVETITEALKSNGLLTPEVSGELHINPVPKACTFLGK